MHLQPLMSNCGCEPCPIDLEELFPTATIGVESPEWRGTRCGWHKTAKLKNGMVVTPSSEGTLWIETRADLSDIGRLAGHGAYIVKIEDAEKLAGYRNARPMNNL